MRMCVVRPRHGPRVSENSRVKPPSPLLARMCLGLKPPAPLRVRNGRFWCIFRLQWCCRFQWSLVGGEQWCRRFHAGLHQWLQRRHWFQRRHVAASCARKSSPCLAQAGYALRAQTKRPPTHHAWAGGKAKTAWSSSAARNVWKVRSHKQRKQHYGRKQCKRRVLTSSRASRGTRWSRAAGSRRAGTGGSRPRARGAR